MLHGYAWKMKLRTGAGTVLIDEQDRDTQSFCQTALLQILHCLHIRCAILYLIESCNPRASADGKTCSVAGGIVRPARRT